MHRAYALDGEVHQDRAGEIESCEEIKIRRQSKGVHDRCGNQPADQVARDVSGNVGRKRAACIHRTALFAEIGQRQRECRCHAQALGDPKDGEHGKIRSDRQ